MSTTERVRRLPRDPKLRATVRERRPLIYTAGADAALDLPAHVRAGSALARLGERLVVLQDDTLAFAVTGPDGTVEAVPLPAGDDGVRQFDDVRGNKAGKPDLEAVVQLDGVLVGIGSGSTSAWERWIVWTGDAPPQWADGATVYAALRSALGDDVELNVEGAVLRDQVLVLHQRGNGRGSLDALLVLDADVVPAMLEGAAVVPEVRRVIPVELGKLGGIRLTPTDLANAPRGLAFVATAEDAPDAVRDGPVVGSAVGWLDRVSGGWTPLREADGRLVRDKVEGLAFADDGDLWVVCDHDDPARPAELLRVHLDGFPWPRLSQRVAPATMRPGGAP